MFDYGIRRAQKEDDFDHRGTSKFQNRLHNKPQVLLLHITAVY